jgi:hypothetical protein
MPGRFFLARLAIASIIQGDDSMTEINVRYWQYTAELFAWSPDIDHRPCPLDKTYQLARNVLAACVDQDGKLNINNGHALIIYDQRNPAFARDGMCDRQWRAAYEALRASNALRRLSWQAFIRQLPSDAMLDWLKEELGAKYGLHSS